MFRLSYRTSAERRTRDLCICRIALVAGLILIPLTVSAAPEDAANTKQLQRGGQRQVLPGTVICMQTPNGGEGTLPFGSRIVAFDPPDFYGGPSSIVTLTPGFTAAGRPDLSFDARRILFVARRKPSEPLSVWEMNVDGSNVRQVTSCPNGCDEAIYLSTIYTLDADKPVYQIAFRSNLPKSRIKALYTCRLDGSRTRRITFTPDDAYDPYLLSDGRLLFSLGTSLDAPPGNSVSVGAASLFTVHTDGTDVFPFAAVHENRALRGMPCETPDGWVVYVESSIDNGDRGGALVAVARTRSLRTKRLISDDSDGSYRSPAPLPNGDLLVSYKAKQGVSYDLYVIDMQTGRRTAGLLKTPQWDELDAVAVAPRREPEGRSSVVVDSAAAGQVYCMNAYLSDTAQGKRTNPGQIKRLRVIHSRSGAGQHADAVSNADSISPAAARNVGNEGVLGEVPVEPDGSFFFDVPARTPLRLETLDQEGNVLQSMKSWIWVMPKESRGCIGCHEDRELTPPNRHVLALRKTPRKLEGVKHTTAPRNAEASPNGGLKP